jgi:RimJ/RimL family protein N-acetyltransferase
MTKDSLLAALPFAVGDFLVRAAVREDVYRRSDWPSYPPPWESFNPKSRGWDAARKERNWMGMRDHAPDEVFLACEGRGLDLAAWFVLRDIDWAGLEVGNMSIRLHPWYCDRGIGSLLASGIFAWCHAQGFVRLRLDVLSTNLRAVRCYEKAGMSRTGEFELDRARYWWMESRTGPGT